MTIHIKRKSSEVFKAAIPLKNNVGKLTESSCSINFFT
jgi:hypothetical protein